MVDADVLRRRIDALLRYLEWLKPFAGVDREAFAADPATHHLAERYLHLATESALDIANHIIADRGYDAPDTYRAAFAILEDSGVIEASLARRLEQWAGFRNILVHAYLDIDHGLCWDAIVNHLGDSRRWAAIAADLL